MARSGCIYGSTGTFKTTAIAHLAGYVAEKTGKATLLFSADGGGWGPVDEEVRAGLIRPYRCDTASIPLPIIRRISQGYWPLNPDETDIGKVKFAPINWDEIGGIAVEGFTSIGTMLMRHCADKALNTGQEATSTFSQPILVTDAEGNVPKDDRGGVVYSQEKFSGNSKAHYNFTQNQLYGMTMNFTSLPVEYVLFTGLDKKGEDDDRSTVGGVSVPGKAITNMIPTWIGDLIHAQDYSVSREVQVPDPNKPGAMIAAPIVETVCRYYFKKHPDPATGIVYSAKPRITHSAVAALEKRFPGGFFQPTADHGFDLYLKAVDELAAKGAERPDLKSWREKLDAKLGRGPTSVPAAKVIKL